MRRFIPVILSILMLMLLLLPACAEKAEVFNEQEGENVTTVKTVLYYADEYGNIIPVMKKIPWEEGIGKAALRQLVASEENVNGLTDTGLEAVLPADTTFDLDIKDGLANLDVRGELKAVDAADESNMVVAMVNTLAEFPTVDKVQIIVNGMKINALPLGTDISKPMPMIELNVEAVPEGLAPKDAYKLTLYFISKSGGYLVPVTRLVAQKPDAEMAIRELLKGPMNTGRLSAVFPEGTRLLDVKCDTGDYIQLNFS
ncbi:MAG: GerMN domain-containing protein, partial [Bacillota bacterium]|nr:GerMN domain-containing protein [Bacillota bacterium]